MKQINFILELHIICHIILYYICQIKRRRSDKHRIMANIGYSYIII